MKRYDVIVVGAGPAGSMAAKEAAEGGLCTLLLEKQDKVGARVQCGEGISQAAFDHTGVRAQNNFICANVDQMNIHFPGGQRVSTKKKGYVLDRTIFDEHLANLAVDAGAQLQTGTRAVEYDRGYYFLTTKGAHNETVKTKILIGCDGFKSNIARWVGLTDASAQNRNLIRAVEYRIKGEDVDKMNFYLSLQKDIYYNWIFPKGDNLANIGAGGPKASFKTLDNFLEEMGIVGKRVKKIGGFIPAGGPLKKTYGDAVMLAGDAASHTNPLFFGGIQTAMYCGKIAGATAVEAIEKEDTSGQFLKSYEDKWREKPLASPDSLEAKKILYSLNRAEMNLVGNVVDGLMMNKAQPQCFAKMYYRIFKTKAYKSIPLRSFITLGKAINTATKWGW